MGGGSVCVSVMVAYGGEEDEKEEEEEREKREIGIEGKKGSSSMQLAPLALQIFYSMTTFQSSHSLCVSLLRKAAAEKCGETRCVLFRR